MPTGLASFATETGAAAQLCSPPRWFRPAGDVRSAWVCEGPFSRTSSRGSAAQKAGIRFESRVSDLLHECFPSYKSGVWFQFLDAYNNRRYCQVDGMVDGKKLFLFEVKIRFTADAFYQLTQLYRPVVEKAFGRRVDGMVQVCRSFDPSVPFPVPVRHLEEINEEAIAAEPSSIGVFTWRV